MIIEIGKTYIFNLTSGVVVAGKVTSLSKDGIPRISRDSSVAYGDDQWWDASMMGWTKYSWRVLIICNHHAMTNVKLHRFNSKKLEDGTITFDFTCSRCGTFESYAKKLPCLGTKD